MPRPVSRSARILAHHLYDFATCEHRITLDLSLPRELRTEPTRGAALLGERGLRHERDVTSALGYTEIRAPEGDFEEAARRTLDAMRSGSDGIAQGLLSDGRHLARPDLLERRSGPSRFGEWHYVPGDIKSALTPRTDAVLQIGFAAKILESVQGIRPTEGFVVLGDGRRENVDLSGLTSTVDDAVEAVEAITDERRHTEPFLSRHCARCRWRKACSDAWDGEGDLSWVYGMTRARRRAYARAGIRTLAQLASSEERDLRSAGAPTDGWRRLRDQARAWIESRAIGRRPVDLPLARSREHYVRTETNPLEHDEPYCFAWASARPGHPVDRSEVVVAADPCDRVTAYTRLVEALRDGSDPEDPIYVYGPGTSGVFARLGDRSGLSPEILGDLQGRFVDLSPWVRRAAALPVLHYGFDEVAEFLKRGTRPRPGETVDERFVAFALDPEAAEEPLRSAARRDLDALRLIRDWLASPSGLSR